MHNPTIEAALHIVNETSNKYLPAPSSILIQAKIRTGIRQFQNYVWWKGFWLKYEAESETDSVEVMEEEIFDEEGLSTNSRPKSKIAMKGSYQLESFLTQLEIELPSIGW